MTFPEYCLRGFQLVNGTLRISFSFITCSWDPRMRFTQGSKMVKNSGSVESRWSGLTPQHHLLASVLIRTPGCEGPIEIQGGCSAGHRAGVSGSRWTEYSWLYKGHCLVHDYAGSFAVFFFLLVRLHGTFLCFHLLAFKTRKRVNHFFLEGGCRENKLKF